MQSLNRLSVRLSVSVNHALITLVGYILTNAVLVVCTYNTPTLSAVLCVQLHYGMESGTRTRKEI